MTSKDLTSHSRRLLTCAVTLVATIAGDMALAGATAPDGVRMTAGEFSAMAASRTLIYRDVTGAAFGAEQHLPDGRVIWSDTQGNCTNGAWQPISGKMCFFYVDAPLDAMCWSVWQTRTDVVAILDVPDADVRFTVEVTDAPLSCSQIDAGA